MSVTPPGGNGMMIRTGLLGYCSAALTPDTSTAHNTAHAATHKTAIRLMLGITALLWMLRPLFDLDLGVVDHLRPFHRFGLDAGREFGRRAGDGHEAEGLELLLHVGQRHELLDLAVERLDHVFRRRGGDDDAGERVALMPGTAGFRRGRHVRQGGDTLR